MNGKIIPMMNGNGKTYLRTLKTALAIALAAALLITLLASSACAADKGEDGSADATQEPGNVGEPVELTEQQKDVCITAAEVFAEADADGLDYDELTLREYERLIYYVYNGELTAEDGAYGKISAEEAETRIRSVFGVSNIRHTGKKTGYVQNFYFEDGSYYIKTNAPFAECSVTGAEWAEDGYVTVTVKAHDVNGYDSVIELTLALSNGNTTVTGCKRYDEI